MPSNLHLCNVFVPITFRPVPRQIQDMKKCIFKQIFLSREVFSLFLLFLYQLFGHFFFTLSAKLSSASFIFYSSAKQLSYRAFYCPFFFRYTD